MTILRVTICWLVCLGGIFGMHTNAFAQTVPQVQANPPQLSADEQPWQVAPVESKEDALSADKENNAGVDRAAKSDSLDVFYLRTSNGQLVPVPDMSFDDFSRLYKLDRQLTSANKLPDFELQEFKLDGSVQEEKDVANFTAKVTVRQLSDGQIRVPLKLPEAIVADGAKLRKTTVAIQFEPERDGYVFVA